MAPDCKSGDESLRWFESNPAHQKSRIFTKFSFFYFYLKLFVSIGITAFHVFSLFNPFSKLFKIICYFSFSARKLHGRIARKNNLSNSVVSVVTRLYTVEFLHGKLKSTKNPINTLKSIVIED